MTKVKICGVTSLKDLKLVTHLGADAVGVITGIPSSPRNITPILAKTLIESIPIFTKSVLVIAPETMDQAMELCVNIKPDAVQIHN